MDDALVEKVLEAVYEERPFRAITQALSEATGVPRGEQISYDQSLAAGADHSGLRRIVEASLRLAAPDLRLAGVKEGLESAYREGFNDARRCLSDDEAFCLTEDVEQDAWLDSETHRSLGPRP